jgi:hypothetical protein
MHASLRAQAVHQFFFQRSSGLNEQTRAASPPTAAPAMILSGLPVPKNVKGSYLVNALTTRVFCFFSRRPAAQCARKRQSEN